MNRFLIDAALIVAFFFLLAVLPGILDRHRGEIVDCETPLQTSQSRVEYVEVDGRVIRRCQ